MHYEYDTKRVCSKKIIFDIEDGIVKNIVFLGGCDGNTKAISKLAEGRTPSDIIKRLEGTNCLFRGTSCPDQFAKALKKAITE